MNEQEKYEIIKKLVEQPNPNKERAALMLSCTKDHVNRMIRGYKKEGKKFFSHKNKNRKPANAVPDSVKKIIVNYYNTMCYGSTFKHFTELLARNLNIVLSVPTVTKILEEAGIYSFKMTKKRAKAIAKKLKEDLEKKNITKKEFNQLHNNLVNIENRHSRRPRAKNTGELIQLDACVLEWVDGQSWHLHVAIDDAKGCVVGAYFDTQETLNGYYNVLYQILTDYGIPYKILTDKRTVFEYTKKASNSIENDTYTQFAYACKQLGIILETTSIPQAKGRVERLNQTLQLRLPIELRLAGVTTIEAANKFLKNYIQEFNKQFALHLDSIKSVFVEQPPIEKINRTLAILCERVVDSGHCIKYKNKYYKMIDSNGLQVHYNKGTSVMVINSFDGNKYCCVNDINIHMLQEIPTHEAKSPNFDADYVKPKPQKPKIPAPNHPWRKSIFGNFVKSQKHHSNNASKQTA